MEILDLHKIKHKLKMYSYPRPKISDVLTCNKVMFVAKFDKTNSSTFQFEERNIDFPPLISTANKII